MTQTTDDSGNMPGTGQSEKIDSGTEKDQERSIWDYIPKLTPDETPDEEGGVRSDAAQAGPKGDDTGGNSREVDNSEESGPAESSSEGDDSEVKGSKEGESAGDSSEGDDSEGKLPKEEVSEGGGSEAGDAEGKRSKEKDSQDSSSKADNFDEDDYDEDEDDYDEDDYDEDDYDEDDYDEDDEDDYDEDDYNEDDEDDYDEDDYDEDPDDDDSDERGMGLNLFTLFVLLFAASITAIYFTCTVRTVHVKGNNLYTSEEIAEKVISDDSQLMHNSVYLTLLYMTPKAPRIPFEESVKVSLNAYDTITITVKDMDIAGFIPYAGKNLYFSADGIVLENSPLTVKDATFVTGLSVTGAEIGTKMTSDDEVGLGMVLEVLQILRKFEIKTDCVVLTGSRSVVMYMDDIKVILGRSNFELKISKISQILPYLEGRSGTIDMTNYTSSDQNIILK